MRIASRWLIVGVVTGWGNDTAILAIETKVLDNAGPVDHLTRSRQAGESTWVGADQQGGVRSVDVAGGGNVPLGDQDAQAAIRQFLCDQSRVGAGDETQVDRSVDRIA